jgi:multisubunit Na+/H+ antiporter MnhC subunit
MRIFSIIWGIIYIAIGTILLLDIFGVIKDVPIVKVTIALILIAVGVKQFFVIAGSKETQTN